MALYTIRSALNDDDPEVEAILKEVQALHIHWRPDLYLPCTPVLPPPHLYTAFGRAASASGVTENPVAGILSFVHRHIEADKQIPREIL